MKSTRDIAQPPYVRAVCLLRDQVASFDGYPFSLPAIRHLDRLELASRSMDAAGVKYLQEAGFRAPEDLPRGAYVGEVTITGCKRLQAAKQARLTTALKAVEWKEVIKAYPRNRTLDRRLDTNAGESNVRQRRARQVSYIHPAAGAN